jgi:hypothetical protein
LTVKRPKTSEQIELEVAEELLEYFCGASGQQNFDMPKKKKGRSPRKKNATLESDRIDTEDLEQFLQANPHLLTNASEEPGQEFNPAHLSPVYAKRNREYRGDSKANAWNTRKSVNLSPINTTNEGDYTEALTQEVFLRLEDMMMNSENENADEQVTVTSPSNRGSGREIYSVADQILSGNKNAALNVRIPPRGTSESDEGLSKVSESSWEHPTGNSNEDPDSLYDGK